MGDLHLGTPIGPGAQKFGALSTLNSFRDAQVHLRGPDNGRARECSRRKCCSASRIPQPLNAANQICADLDAVLIESRQDLEALHPK